MPKSTTGETNKDNASKPQENLIPARVQNSPVVMYLKLLLRFLFKSWVGITSFIGSLVVLLAVLFFLVFSSSSDFDQANLNAKVIEEGGADIVAVVNLTGPIIETVNSEGPFAFEAGIISSKKTSSLLMALEKDDFVKAIVLRVNSPGGGVVASDDLYRVISRVSETKPVVVSFSEVAASGGYYISAGASKIVANPATITGSIGVIAQYPELSGLFDKVGIELRTFKSGEFKDIGAIDREIRPEEIEIIDTIIQESYDQFVDAIVEGRGMDEAEVRRISDGRIYTGRQAQELGLVDELGGLDLAIDEAGTLAEVSDPSIIEYSSGGFLESLLEARIFSPLRALTSSPLNDGFGVYYLMSF